MIKKPFKRSLIGIVLRSILISATLLSLLLGCSSSSVASSQNPPGRIAFLWSAGRTGSSTLKLILSDGNGNNLRFVGFFVGSPAFSPSGSLIAIGCPPTYDDPIASKLCILDVNKFISARQQIPVDNYDARFAITSKLALPEQCLKYQYGQGASLQGILSIDWSPKADKLVIVCGDVGLREVCIIPLEGETSCWDHTASKKVFRAVWSPVDENVIAVADWLDPESKIYLVNSSGTNPKYIADGWNPEWSPDGERIAYVENISNPLTNRSSQGIASIDLNGSNHKWLYKPDPADDLSYIDLDGSSSGWPSRLAWSPDSRYIMFSGIQGNLFNFRIFRLDISTGKVTILVDPGIFNSVVVEPDWGP